MPTQAVALKLRDRQPGANFYDDVVTGLRQPQKQIPCKYFYDQRGSQLFDRICELPEYYPTRSELGIMQQHAAEMSALAGSDALLIEYGSGSSLKTRILLDHLDRPVGYVPIDISREHLLSSAAALARRYPHIEVMPLCADYTAPLKLPRPKRPARRRVMYFPGSTIGNFPPAAARRFLKRVASRCGANGGLLIGVDLIKDTTMLERAYNDRQGVTAEFNLNVLRRINCELGANFDLSAFEHRAPFNTRLGRIEMHLVSRCDQRARINGFTAQFRAGETIHTENSYKYELSQFAALAHSAGWQVQQVWTDPRRLFSVQYLTVAT